MDWRITATAMVLGIVLVAGMLGLGAADLMRRVSVLEEQVWGMRALLR